MTELAQHPLGADLAFKGGTALRRLYYPDYRFSEDLDFTILKEGMPFEDIRAAFDIICASVKQKSGIDISFDRMDTHHQHVNSYTFFLKYKGPLPRQDEVKVDMTKHETLAFPLEQMPVLKTYPEYDDLSLEPKVQVYSLREIVAEKLIAITDKARNEPRDLYDFCYLLRENPDIRLEDLSSEIETKLKRRNRDLYDVEERLENKKQKFGALWEKRLAHQIDGLEGFEDVFREVSRQVRDADFGSICKPP